MCAFHQREVYGDEACIVEYMKSEDDHAPNADSVNSYLEYVSNSEDGCDYYATLDGSKMRALTRGQRKKNQTSSLAHIQKDSSIFDPRKAINLAPPVSHKEPGNNSSELFNIVQHIKKTPIKISMCEYLKLKPNQLQRLLFCCKGDGIENQTKNATDGRTFSSLH